MIKIHYTQFKDYSLNFAELIKKIPYDFRSEILKYRKSEDRLSRLFSFLLLENLLESIGYSTEIIKLLKRDQFNRPYLPIKEDFNISHSGDLVIVAISDLPIGVDIELIKEIDWQSLLSFFHIDEIDFICNSKEPILSFYEIWVKKEAVLKANGKGLSEGMDHFSCLNTPIALDGVHWNLYPIPVHQNFSAFISSPLIMERLIIHEQTVEDLL